jgi:PAS domain S-box-containing protein
MEFSTNVLFRSIIEVYPYPLVITDLNNRYVFVNNSFLYTLGQANDADILGKTSAELGIKTTLSEANQILERIRQNGYLNNIQIAVVGPVTRTLMCSSKLIHYSQQEFVLTVTVDVTRQLSLESKIGESKAIVNEELDPRIKELEKLKSELEIRVEELRMANEKLDLLLNSKASKPKKLSNRLIEYININAHEVRAPLARILGLVRVLSLAPDSMPVVTGKLELSALELDTIIRKMNQLLQDALDLYRWLDFNTRLNMVHMITDEIDIWYGHIIFLHVRFLEKLRPILCVRTFPGLSVILQH